MYFFLTFEEFLVEFEKKNFEFLKIFVDIMVIDNQVFYNMIKDAKKSQRNVTLLKLLYEILGKNNKN
jgi:hypothetical protein